MCIYLLSAPFLWGALIQKHREELHTLVQGHTAEVLRNDHLNPGSMASSHSELITLLPPTLRCPTSCSLSMSKLLHTEHVQIASPLPKPGLLRLLTQQGPTSQSVSVQSQVSPSPVSSAPHVAPTFFLSPCACGCSGPRLLQVGDLLLNEVHQVLLAQAVSGCVLVCEGWTDKGVQNFRKNLVQCSFSISLLCSPHRAPHWPTTV